MDYQKKTLLESLIEKGWVLKEEAQPTSSAYWWVYEMLEFEKEDRKLYVSFLVRQK